MYWFIVCIILKSFDIFSISKTRRTRSRVRHLTSVWYNRAVCSFPVSSQIDSDSNSDQQSMKWSCSTKSVWPIKSGTNYNFSLLHFLLKALYRLERVFRNRYNHEWKAAWPSKLALPVESTLLIPRASYFRQYLPWIGIKGRNCTNQAYTSVY